MSGLPKREKLDPKRASAMDFAVAQGISTCRARPIHTIHRHVPILNDLPSSISLTIKVLCSVRVGVKRRPKHDNVSNKYICLWR